MKRILLATRNSGKLRELQSELQDCGIELVLPEQVGVPPEFDPPEVGQSFQEVAIQKAKAYAEQAQMLALADDSGLSVVALHGQPGIYSKRFVPGTDSDRNQRILQLLEHEPNRAAFFTTVLCLYDPFAHTGQCFEGRVDGQIGYAEQGTAGFGYDAIFIPAGYSQTFGQLGMEVKNQISHRSRAMAKFKMENCSVLR